MPDCPVINALALADETCQQRFIANRVHQSGNPLAIIINSPKSRRRKSRRSTCAGDLQPMLNVLVDLVTRERRQVITNRDALAQLAQSRVVEFFAQLWLA